MDLANNATFVSEKNHIEYATMNQNSLYSINQLSEEEILRILDMAECFERQPNRDFLQGRVAATLLSPPRGHASASRPLSIACAAG